MSNTPKTDELREVVIEQYKENELTGNGMGNILAALADVEELERDRDAAREPLDFFDATNSFIDSGLLHYANHSSKGLTQVFMRGPFAGWSERKLIELIQQLDKNRKLYRLEP